MGGISSACGMYLLAETLFLKDEGQIWRRGQRSLCYSETTTNNGNGCSGPFSVLELELQSYLRVGHLSNHDVMV